ncbi:MAG TPA: nucleoside kinase [Candidatus Avanaerovorax faecigallinarum]|nr:nucleoside kinase [Candidatus Avanaerovorax faecigallinarum]
MRVKLRTEPRGDYENIDVMTGTSVKEIADDLADRLPYTVIAAKVDNHIEDLDFVLEEPCKVELLDIRTQAANLIYQYSLSLIYLKAVKDTLGDDVRVEIQNSLNKGLYTEIKTKEPVTEEQVQAVENRMRELVDADLPFIKTVVDRDEAIRIIKEDGRTEKLRLLSETLGIKQVKFYTLDGYRNFFYGLMAPSTGYIKYFQLMKYRRGVLLRFPHQSAPDRIPDYVDEVKLYQAFGEQTRWDALLGVNYVADLNDKIESGEYKELIQLSEALHEKKIAEIADMIKTQKKRLVLIAGPSSSGKTTFARRLCIQLRVNGLKPLYMGTDDYFVEREDTPLDEKGEKDFENLDALDIDLFNKNMNDLLAGKKVDLPEFDFMTGHKVFGKRITSIDPSQPIVIEGIHGLNGKLTEFIPDGEKFKIYISPLTQLNIDMHNRIPTTDERMLRRMVRDYLYRGHSAQSTINQWPKVRAGEDKNIFPYSGEADVLFNSYHVYEISVLKKYAEPLLRKIAPDEEEYAEAVRMLKFLRFFRTIEDDSIIVNNSIIREFIGGSIFVD